MCRLIFTTNHINTHLVSIQVKCCTTAHPFFSLKIKYINILTLRFSAYLAYLPTCYTGAITIMIATTDASLVCDLFILNFR